MRSTENSSSTAESTAPGALSSEPLANDRAAPALALAGGQGTPPRDDSPAIEHAAEAKRATALAAGSGAPSPEDPTRTSQPTQSPIPPQLSAAPTATQVRDPKRYRVLGEHGRGGLGRVSRAHDIELGRDVAIKELIARNHIGEVRFLREALITARLEHPGIVPVHEAGRWPDGTPFYAMKLVSGRPLRDLIAERKTVDERIGLLHHVIAVADAIAYAHGQNIIHRDLKPSNVIVGDFGETVVIDWGLAKDITATEEQASHDGPSRGSCDDGLTSAGAILGTPAYMPPEQARGEPVDQRADVFAIGAMLWELCSLDPLPPAYSGQRARILRRAGVDQDLAAIILKALDPVPERRYSEAGTLTADFKAFKAGARIAARRYTPWAVSSRWIRRHRLLTLSTLLILLTAVTGLTRYVHDVTVQRDRADASEQEAKRASLVAEDSLRQLALNHAQLLLNTDPAAALDVLRTAQVENSGAADRIRAEAQGRGAAVLRASPHTNNVLWLQGISSGSILSLSIDGTIALTSRDGISTTLYQGVLAGSPISSTASSRLLAFGCVPQNICLLDIAHQSILSPEILHGIRISGVSFSPDGTKFAAMTKNSELRIYDIRTPEDPKPLIIKHIAHGVNVLFVDDKTVAAGTSTGVELVDMTGRSEHHEGPDEGMWDSDPDIHQLAFGTTGGDLVVLNSSPLRIAGRRHLCNGRLVAPRFLSGRHIAGYACEEGTIGNWNIQTNAVQVYGQLESKADSMQSTRYGDFLFTAATDGTLAIIDIKTAIISTYRGHTSRIVAISPPTKDFPELLTGDARGEIRAWHMPEMFAQSTTLSDLRLLRAIPEPHSSGVIVSSWAPHLIYYSRSTGVQRLTPHIGGNFLLQTSPDGKLLAAYGFGDSIELWDVSTLRRIREIDSKQISITRLIFQTDNSFITSGRDGRIVHWALSGSSETLAHMNTSIDQMTQQDYPALSIAFATADGKLYHLDSHGSIHVLEGDRTASRVTCLTSDETGVLYVGYANGDLLTVDRNGNLSNTHIDRHAIRDIVARAHDDFIAVATTGEQTYLGHIERTDIATKTGKWQAVPASVNHLAVSRSGVLVLATIRGDVLMYSIFGKTWKHMTTGHTNLAWAAISADDSTAIAVGNDGHLIQIDLQTAVTSH